MLQELRISNLALIQTLVLDFSSNPTGLIVFTGETGAGKSIILQAVHLLTGGRASASWVRSGSEQVLVEASFDIRTNSAVQTLLRAHGFDQGEDCILRRIVTKTGSSRIFINDRRSTARFAAELSTYLVNISGQHDQQMLLKSSRHIDFLDTYGDILEQRQHYSQLYLRWQKLLRRLKHAQEQEQGKEQRRDFLTFQLQEIRTVNLSPGEDASLIQERDLLKASTSLTDLVGKSLHSFQSKVDIALTDMRKNMEQALALDSQLKDLAERLNSAYFELEDIGFGLSQYLEALPADLSRMDAIAARLAQIRQVQRKYGTSIEEVLAFADKVAADLQGLESLEQEINALEQEAQALAEQVQQQAAALSQARCHAAVQLAQAMQGEFASLALPQARFEVLQEAFSQQPSRWTAEGWDKIHFFFSANPGEALKPLQEVVSGGELSRLMLALKCLLAQRDKVASLILDEVDAGIGGEAASAVARKIDLLAKYHQVFCITHLPQIAAYADTHFVVEKTIIAGNRTQTAVRTLQEEERSAELARMLGGDTPTHQTFALAQELLHIHKEP
jgi:DNA repair protein RecN (Recombination protein N)